MFKISKITPVFNQILVTKNKYSYEESKTNTGLIDGTKAHKIKEYQTIIAVGELAKQRGFEPGQIVFFTPKRYSTILHKQGSLNEIDNTISDQMHVDVDIPTFTIWDDKGSKEVMLIGDNDVYFIAEGEEFNERPLVVNDSKIIL